MPGLLQYLTDLQCGALTTSNDGSSHVHAKDMDLWLPSMLPIHLWQHICIQIEGATDGLPEIEKKLRQAQCHSALDSFCHALFLKSHMVDWKNSNAQGQKACALKFGSIESTMIAHLPLLSTGLLGLPLRSCLMVNPSMRNSHHS